MLLDEKLRALEARSETIEGYSSQAYVANSFQERTAREFTKSVAVVETKHFSSLACPKPCALIEQSTRYLRPNTRASTIDALGSTILHSPIICFHQRIP